MVNQVVENNDYEMVPGTVHLIDINEFGCTKMVISFTPQPTNNPNDP